MDENNILQDAETLVLNIGKVAREKKVEEFSRALIIAVRRQAAIEHLVDKFNKLIGSNTSEPDPNTVIVNRDALITEIQMKARYLKGDVGALEESIEKFKSENRYYRKCVWCWNCFCCCSNRKEIVVLNFETHVISLRNFVDRVENDFVANSRKYSPQHIFQGLITMHINQTVIDLNPSFTSEEFEAAHELYYGFGLRDDVCRKFIFDIFVDKLKCFQLMYTGARAPGSDGKPTIKIEPVNCDEAPLLDHTTTCSAYAGEIRSENNDSDEKVVVEPRDTIITYMEKTTDAKLDKFCLLSKRERGRFLKLISNTDSNVARWLKNNRFKSNTVEEFNKREITCMGKASQLTDEDLNNFDLSVEERLRFRRLRIQHNDSEVAKWLKRNCFEGRFVEEFNKHDIKTIEDARTKIEELPEKIKCSTISWEESQRNIKLQLDGNDSEVATLLKENGFKQEIVVAVNALEIITKNQLEENKDKLVNAFGKEHERFLRLIRNSDLTTWLKNNGFNKKVIKAFKKNGTTSMDKAVHLQDDDPIFQNGNGNNCIQKICSTSERVTVAEKQDFMRLRLNDGDSEVSKWLKKNGFNADMVAALNDCNIESMEDVQKLTRTKLSEFKNIKISNVERERLAQLIYDSKLVKVAMWLKTNGFEEELLEKFKEADITTVDLSALELKKSSDAEYDRLDQLLRQLPKTEVKQWLEKNEFEKEVVQIFKNETYVDKVTDDIVSKLKESSPREYDRLTKLLDDRRNTEVVTWLKHNKFREEVVKAFNEAEIRTMGRARNLTDNDLRKITCTLPEKVLRELNQVIMNNGAEMAKWLKNSNNAEPKKSPNNETGEQNSKNRDRSEQDTLSQGDCKNCVQLMKPNLILVKLDKKQRKIFEIKSETSSGIFSIEFTKNKASETIIFRNNPYIRKGFSLLVWGMCGDRETDCKIEAQGEKAAEVTLSRSGQQLNEAKRYVFRFRIAKVGDMALQKVISSDNSQTDLKFTFFFVDSRGEV